MFVSVIFVLFGFGVLIAVRFGLICCTVYVCCFDCCSACCGVVWVADYLVLLLLD